MNREIKFRIWNPEQKLMTIESLCSYMGFHGIVYNLVGCNNPDNVWMQFTGLTDKNGKECYEGDIIKWQYLSYKEPCITKVEYIDALGEFCITPDDRGEREPFEIIGNIYQNPELIKS